MIDTLTLFLLGLVGIYPIFWSAIWISGALVFTRFERQTDVETPPRGWPPVSVLIPAFNEEAVIATCVRAALDADYPDCEVLVLDDGSSDGTVRAAAAAAGGDPRLRVVRDQVNLGKAARLNLGFEQARHELVAVCDADTHMHPLALKLLVKRLNRSSLNAAVGGGPHVTNRRGLLVTMQVIEAASIIGLIRRTQAVGGRVGVVAGVLALFRREAVLEVGGYRSEMATEDIDLSWRLGIAGWLTTYEPAALVGMQVPSTLRSLWAQRKRWARGGGEVLRVNGGDALRWRNRRLWPLVLEAGSSLEWVLLFATSAVLGLIAALVQPGIEVPYVQFALGWGIAIAVVGMLQLAFALGLNFEHDRYAALAFIFAPFYPLAFWMFGSIAALLFGVPALLRGPREDRTSWDIERDPLEPSSS